MVEGKLFSFREGCKVPWSWKTCAFAQQKIQFMSKLDMSVGVIESWLDAEMVNNYRRSGIVGLVWVVSDSPLLNSFIQTSQLEM